LRPNKPDNIIDIEEIDREIEELDEKLKELQALGQRRADLYNFKLLAQRLWGKPTRSGSHAVPAANGSGNGHGGAVLTNAEFAFHVLSSNPKPLSLEELVAGMRAAGWRCSGDDGTDKKRAYAAIYKHTAFARDDESNWRLAG
jgi:hypothetical protein